MTERAEAAAPPVVRELGIADYRTTWARMRAFTDGRDASTPDELWVLQHPAVFTQGQAGRPENLLCPGDIPVVCSDRGGQVTYHGPGQIVIYVLLDLRRFGLGVRSLVTLLEQSMIGTLADHGVAAFARREAPGVYVRRAFDGTHPESRKIGSLGLRIRRGCCYHGLAFNAAMDLSPFDRINPCGYPGLRMTQMADLVHRTELPIDVDAIAHELIKRLLAQLALRSARQNRASVS
ncbi:MAG TPA: lipoyl(octanoyl) transferase LipB [Nevskiaceae bacterium]